MAINFLLELVSSHANLVGVDHYNVISAIEVRCIVRLILADQHPRDTRRYAAQNLPAGVNNKPTAALLDLFGFPSPGDIRAHVLSHTFPSVVKLRQYRVWPLLSMKACGRIAGCERRA